MTAQESISTLVARAVLVSCLLCSTAVFAGSDRTETETQIVSAGVIVVERAELRSEPNDTANVIEELSFGEPFYILNGKDYRRTRYRTGPPVWFKVVLTDRQTKGWISSLVAQQYPTPYIDMGLADLYYSAAVSLSGKEQYDAAESLFAKALREPDSARVVFDRSGWMTKFARDATLEQLAEMSERRKDYDRALELYEELTTSDDTTTAAMAWLSVSEVYMKGKVDFEQAIQANYETIRRFQNLTVFPCDECVVDMDVTAAERILDLLKSDSADAEAYFDNGEKLIGISKNPTAGIIGYIILCEGHKILGEYSRIAETMTEGLRKWPVGFKSGFKTYWRDYAGEAIAFVVKTFLEELDDPGSALKFCDGLIAETSNDTLLYSLLLTRALILDIGEASREATTQALRGAQLQARHGAGQDPFPRYYPKSRLDDILTFLEYETIVLSPDLIARSRPEHNAKAKFTLNENERVSVLYGPPFPHEDTWVKIRARDDQYGWVQRSSLRPPLVRQLNAFDDGSNWWCGGANTAQTRSVGGPPILKPTLRWHVPQVGALEIVYADADQDGITDLIVSGWKDSRIAVISGRDMDIIWDLGKASPRTRYYPPCTNKDLLSFSNVQSVEVVRIEKGQRVKWLRLNRSTPTPILSGDTVFFYGNNPLRTDDLGTWILGFGLSVGEMLIESTKEHQGEGFPLTLDTDRRSIMAVGYSLDRSRVSALSMDNGEELWTYNAETRIVAPVVVQDSLVLLLAEGRGAFLHVLDKANGNLLFRIDTGICGFRGMATNHGFGVVACARKLKAFDLDDGEQVWELEADSVSAAPCIVDTVLYVGEATGFIHALNLRTGQLIWTYNTELERWGNPTGSLSASSGMLSFVTGKGYLFVLGESD